MLLEKNAQGGYMQRDGAFLVRPSESTPGEFSLSVKWVRAVIELKLYKSDPEFKIKMEILHLLFSRWTYSFIIIETDHIDYFHWGINIHQRKREPINRCLKHLFATNKYSY